MPGLIEIRNLVKLEPLRLPAKLEGMLTLGEDEILFELIVVLHIGLRARVAAAPALEAGNGENPRHVRRIAEVESWGLKPRKIFVVEIEICPVERNHGPADQGRGEDVCLFDRDEAVLGGRHGRSVEAVTRRR